MYICTYVLLPQSRSDGINAKVLLSTRCRIDLISIA